MAQESGKSPSIKWEDNEWSITLPLEDGRVLNASWKPGVTYVVRIREAGSEEWSFGFETPITTFTFIDLKPDTEYQLQLQTRRRRSSSDTEYQLQVRTKNAAGEGAPAFFSIRTDPAGDAGNVIPFPLH